MEGLLLERLHSIGNYLKVADEEDKKLIEITLDKLVEQEVLMIKAKIKRYENISEKFRQKYGMSFDEFKKRFEAEEIGEDMDYLEWSSAIDAEKHWKAKLDALKLKSPAPT